MLDEIKPALIGFLEIRGLSLSAEKTKLSHINDGFNFLGFNVRKYKHKLLINPQDGKVHDLLIKVKDLLASHRGIPFHVLLIKLNSIVRGWAHAYRRIVSKERMGFVDYRLYYLVRKWLRGEHRSKTWSWIAKRHRLHDLGRWDFYAVYFTGSGRRLVKLFRAAYLPIRYHVKIRSVANPYDPEFDEYFSRRELTRKLLAMSDRIHLNTDSVQRLAA